MIQPRLLIVHSDPLSANDRAMAALSEFMGVSSVFLHFSHLLSDRSGGERDKRREKICAATSGDTLARLLRAELFEKFSAFISEHVSFLFVYGLYPGELINKAIRGLTEGVVKGVTSQPAGRRFYEINRDSKGICRQLAGLRIEPARDNGDHAVELAGGGGGAEVLVSTGGGPCFVKVDTKSSSIFLAANTKVTDVRCRVSDQRHVKDVFSSLFPAAMYIKHVFGHAAWHNETSRACLTVDDPLLKKNYGFLNYKKLLHAMDLSNFTTSIAFIPWNFRRTSPDIGDLFVHRPDRFSVCVHGCDHTQNEFGSIDRASLDGKVKTATRRMNDHTRRTGVAFDNVMVFPQGAFSTHSVAVLKSNNYLAALNGDPFAVDVERSLEIRSLLEPAVMAYGKFPLFVRRFPDEVVELAMDLFWGRPALILAHHDFFKEGYGQVAESMGKINALDRDIQWSGVGEIIRRSHLSRQEVPGVIEVKSYIPHTVIENYAHSRVHYRVSKGESDRTSIASVISQEKETAYTFSNGSLCLSMVLDHDEKGSIEIVYKDGCLDRSRRTGASRDRLAILSRRYLSEFRDNYISKSDFLLSVATKLKDLLLQQGAESVEHRAKRQK